MKTILIVEDNETSVEILEKVVRSVDDQSIIKAAANEDEAYLIAMKNNISLFLIDIVLNPLNPGDVSGMNFANQIRSIEKYKYTPIIFVTAIEDSKLYAYSDVHCYYYLEKPFDLEKASKVISEALRFPQIENKSQAVYFRKDGILYKRDISEVIYIENTRLGQKVYLTDGILELQYKPCKIILEEIMSDKLSQCSRSVIVNKDYIDSVDPISRYIKLKNGYGQIDIGVSFKKRFMKDICDD
ncbi:MAG: LytTR family DNA-binding domain-containing protein [Bacillota bacterium]|nr:LytTR family DNA-binding domain-containing protein [Bacillota bacterium]